MLHLTEHGYNAGAPICGVGRSEADRYQHYSLTYKIPAAPDLCPDCAAIYKIAEGILLRNLVNVELVQNDRELRDLLGSVGLPREDWGDITGAAVELGEGDYKRVYLTEESRWYELDAVYYALPWYGKVPIPANYPLYWQLATYTEGSPA
jgi:hypothetical protein